MESVTKRLVQYNTHLATNIYRLNATELPLQYNEGMWSSTAGVNSSDMWMSTIADGYIEIHRDKLKMH